MHLPSQLDEQDCAVLEQRVADIEDVFRTWIKFALLLRDFNFKEPLFAEETWAYLSKSMMEQAWGAEPSLNPLNKRRF